MYLKRLHLHGFKSFAARTTLEFSPGMTSIVGPNGSGKSNVADSLRWVLGEQSMRQLRGKKSEDIIFAGGHGRGAQGMAEVTLTLDNSSGWLPSEHVEVTVSRRIFRSGEAEYFINGARVRLKDMLALLAQARIGHDSYTIIGQGLVDQALSSRAEERRSLFEDAAGIRQFLVQRNEAEQRLTLTHTNLSRLHDILSEIEPRLAPLAEQARRAQEYITARAEVDRLQRRWFGQQWNIAHIRHDAAAMEETTATARAEELRATLGQHDDETAQLQEARATLTSQITEIRRHRGEAIGRVQALERDQAVGQERATSLEQQITEIQHEQTQGTGALEATIAEIARLEGAQAESESAIADETEAIGTLESADHRARQQRERDDARLRNAQRDVMQAQAKVTAAQSEFTRLQKQRDDRQSTLAQRRDAAMALRDRAGEAASRADALRKRHETGRGDLGARLVERESLNQRIGQDANRLELTRASLGEAQRAHRAVADRLDLLQSWTNEHNGSAAAMSTLAKIPDDDRPVILGTLATLLRADAQGEAAFEAALGPYLEALVAASEDDAWRCAEILFNAGVGRLTVLWPVASAATPISDPPPARRNGNTNGHGATLATKVAAPRLVDHLALDLPSAVAEVIHTLIGPMALVESTDLAGLRWQMHDAAIVTPSGTVAHPAGRIITGVAQGADQGQILARARELRELPAQVAVAEAQVREMEGLVANARATLEDARTSLAEVERAIKARENQLAEEAKALAVAQRDAEKLAGEATLAETIAEQMAGEALQLGEEIAACDARMRDAESARVDAADVLETLQQAAEAAIEAARAAEADLAARRTALAVRHQESTALRERLLSAQRQITDQHTQRDRREARLGELAHLREEVRATITTQSTELQEHRQRARDFGETLHQHEADLTATEQQIAHLDAARAAGRVELTQAETDLRRSLLEAQRARDALEALHSQMIEEMGEEDAVSIIARADSGDEEIEPEELARMRRQIDSLRNRLKSLGGYDPEAPQAYEELKTRYEFLTTQVRDLEEAAARLRAVILELDATMRRRFEETFQAVNERFRQHFTTLFQGGTARLELTAPRNRRRAEDDDDDDATEAPEDAIPSRKGITGGVEIYVQVPGKKVQDLTLLSGGERALVSAALLFALLETNPPPFCLLDEVDAALDEANVVRFCEILGTLSQQTQFIVITHNRVTMTHANAIYGVSMTESVSRILSMRLADVPVR